MREIHVEAVSCDRGDAWWVYEDDVLLAKFYGRERDALDYADLKRLEP